MEIPKRRNSFNNIYFGALLGLIFPVVGFVLYYLYFFYGHLSLTSYWDMLFNKHKISAALSLSLLVNFGVFMFFISGSKYLTARGVLAVTIVYAAFDFIFFFV